MFEKEVMPCSFTLYLDAPEDLLNERLIHRENIHRDRGIQRSDDNESCRKKRFKVHKEQCIPVVQYYAEQEKLISVPATGDISEVHEKLKKLCITLLDKEGYNKENHCS